MRHKERRGFYDARKFPVLSVNDGGGDVASHYGGEAWVIGDYLCLS